MTPLHFPRRAILLWTVAAAIVFGVLHPASAQSNYATPYYFTTLAGNGTEGSIDGTGPAARFAFPNDVAIDANGNVYVADTDNGRIRRITPAGVVTTVTGTNGTALFVGGVRGIALDGAGNIYVGGFLSHTIQKITPAGVLSVLAGQTNTSGTNDGIGSAARFNLPIGLAVDANGTVFVADSGNHAIRKITAAGQVTTLAGLAGTAGSKDGLRNTARFHHPSAVALNSVGILIVADSLNHTIRKVTPGGEVTTFVGTAGVAGSLDATGAAALFNQPRGVAVDSNHNVYVSSFAAHTIRKITSFGVVTTVAGIPGLSGSVDGRGATARLTPHGLALDSAGNLYVADGHNEKIRRSVFPPSFLFSANEMTIAPGSSSFLNALVKSDHPVTIQWLRNGASIPGATTTPLRLTNAQPADAGLYSVSASNVAGFSRSEFISLAVSSPPVITSQPISGRTVLAGIPVAFSVTVSPAIGPSFVWRKDGVAIPGATNGIYEISKVGPGDAGQYSVVVTNVGTSVTSNAASLAVIEEFSVRAPAPKAANAGETTELVAVVHAAVDSIRWRKDGDLIPGATTATLTRPNVTAADAGIYEVQITGSLGTASASTSLTVYAPPTIVTQPTSRSLVIGQPVQFSVAVTPSIGPTFQWLKDGNAISGATNADYTIASMRAFDAGTYSVVMTEHGLSVPSNSVGLTERPTVTAPPVQIVNPGTTVEFTAVVTPLTAAIQWRKFNVAIPGATSASLTLSNVTAADAGIYGIEATNGFDSAFATTILAVYAPPTITTQPASQTATVGQAAMFSVAVTPSTGATFQWRKNGAAISGARSATFTIPTVSTGDAGTYSVVVTRDGLSVTSDSAALTVDVPVNTQPVTHTVFVGSRVQFNFTSAPATGTTFQWRKDGVPITGATTASLIIPSATVADAGNYNVVFALAGVSQTSNTATLIVLPLTAPTINAQPLSQSVLLGATMQFKVSASSPTALTFQWRKNGSAITGATNEILTLNNAQPADAGSYSVIVSNAAGAVTSNTATLTVNPLAGTAPTINTHPANQNVTVGALIALSVSASGTAPLAFQWYRNGAVLPSATAALLSIANAQIADEATYAVVISNSAGVAASNAAIVRVITPPSITAHPAGQTVVAGTNLQFSIIATGSTPFSYQWRRDGSPIPGATNAVLALNAVEPTSAGSYTVEVANPAGTVTSNRALLTITPAGPSARLSNVSIRTTLPAGQAVIVGFTIDGGTRDVLVRVVGPTLTAFNVGAAMADPRLELFRGETLVAANEDWVAALAPAFASVGAFALPISSRDAALVQSLSGAHSLHARGTGAGTVLVEAYDVGTGNRPRLVNISARNRVGTGEDILIAGFTITGTGSKQLLIRAVGPGLASFNVPGSLPDPSVEVFTGTGERVGGNDNWSADLIPSFTAVGAFSLPAGSRDAALLMTLPVGSYTVQVRGVNGGIGEAIIEIYEVP